MVQPDHLCCHKWSPRTIYVVTGPGFGHYEGRLEVFYNYQWKTVCDDGWGWEESAVVCKSLGYSLGAQSYNHGAQHGQGSRKYF